jgi:hypothetical protein
MAIELPTLYQRNQDGKMKQWRVWTEGDVVVTEFGLVSGKKVETRRRAEPTNDGRSNARNGVEQAEFEAQAKWRHQVDRECYLDDIKAAEEALILLPMLAQPYEKRTVNKKTGAEKIRRVDLGFPCSAQRKYNGLRCCTHVVQIIESSGGATWASNYHGIGLTHRSRGDVVWDTLDHLHASLRELQLRPGDFIDGELYRHGVPLQRINSWVKKFDPNNTPSIQYMIYDLARAEKSYDTVWEDRWEALRLRYWTWVYSIAKAAEILPSISFDVFIKCCEDWLWNGARCTPDSGLASLERWLLLVVPGLPIQLAETRVVRSWEDVKAFEAVAIAGGYEGLILRQHGRTYDFNGRPDNLVKVKQFIEADFRIVDAACRELPGSPGQPSVFIIDKFVVENDDGTGKTFETVPRGTLSQKAEMWKKWLAGEFAGCYATVSFPERSVDNVPQGNTPCIGVKMPDDIGAQRGGNAEDDDD